VPTVEAFLEDLWRDRLDHPPLTGGRTPLFSTAPEDIVGDRFLSHSQFSPERAVEKGGEEIVELAAVC